MFSNRRSEVQRAVTRRRKFLCHCSRFITGHHVPPQSAIFKKTQPESRLEAANLLVCGKYTLPRDFIRPHTPPQLYVEILTTSRAITCHHVPPLLAVFKTNLRFVIGGYQSIKPIEARASRSHHVPPPL